MHNIAGEGVCIHRDSLVHLGFTARVHDTLNGSIQSGRSGVVEDCNIASLASARHEDHTENDGHSRRLLRSDGVQHHKVDDQGTSC